MKKILLEKLLDNCKEQEYQKQYEYYKPAGRKED